MRPSTASADRRAPAGATAGTPRAAPYRRRRTAPGARPGHRLRCFPRRPTGRCRHPARLRWRPPSSARPSRHRAPPGTGVRERAGSRGRRRCTDRAWPTQGIDGGRYRGCRVRKHRSGNRSPPAPAPRRPDKCARESTPTRGSRIRRQSGRYRARSLRAAGSTSHGRRPTGSTTGRYVRSRGGATRDRVVARRRRRRPCGATGSPSSGIPPRPRAGAQLVRRCIQSAGNVGSSPRTPERCAATA